MVALSVSIVNPNFPHPEPTTMTILTALRNRVTTMPRELKLFVFASFSMGIAFSLYDSVFNNFLNARFELTGFQRSFLELPRELPGFLVMFVSAFFWFLCSRRLGGVAMLMGVAGALLIGFASSSYAIMTIWLFIYSMGQHLYMPVASTIGMELAREGHTGKRLGQLNALRNIAAIAGSALVFVGFKYLGLTFQITFILAAIGLLIAALLLFSMQRQKPKSAGMHLKLHKEYKVFYALNVLSGSRKQIFITFAPWVLITIFNQPTQTIATLMTIGGVIGILFQPFLGRAIDKLGERTILAAEAVALIFVCLGYGFARDIFPQTLAFYLTCFCYLMDQMLFSVSMARSTYIKKIALDPADIQPTLAAGVSIDHVFSITIALFGGLVWNAFGYQNVFLLGVAIAAINFFVALQAKIPKSPTLSSVQS